MCTKLLFTTRFSVLKGMSQTLEQITTASAKHEKTRKRKMWRPAKGTFTCRGRAFEAIFPLSGCS